MVIQLFALGQFWFLTAFFLMAIRNSIISRTGFSELSEHSVTQQPPVDPALPTVSTAQPLAPCKSVLASLSPSLRTVRLGTVLL